MIEERKMTRAERLKNRLSIIRKKTVLLLLTPFIFFRKLCFWIGFLTLIFFFAFSLMIFLLYRSLPDIRKMPFKGIKELARERIYNRLEDKGKIYKWVPLRMMNRDLIYSVIMSEDANYFSHNGINYDALINSLAENIKQRKFVVGGSTISQQVVKNIFLDNKKSMLRKFKELIITRRIEKRCSKNEILELYLNIAEFGPDIFGVNASSYYYFKKSPSNINAAEGAFMALMLPSPKKNHYRLYQNKNLSGKWRKKLHRILKDMRYNDFISEEQYRYYLNYPYLTNHS